MHHMRAAHLNDASVPTALGRRWQAMSVWTIVRRTQPKRQRRTA
jgi:hypothetical protein